MRKIRTRAFSILLTCAMLLSLLPVTALAAGGVECTAPDCSHEAAIGSTHYDTIGEAIDAANASSSGGTIKLLTDATLEGGELDSVGKYYTVKRILKNITLDLGGNTLTYGENGGFAVDPKWHFTIQNGTYINTSDDQYAQAITSTKDSSNNSCTITIASSAAIKAHDGIVSTGNAVLEIYGTIIAENVAVFGMGPKNNVTLDGAEIQAGTYGVYQQEKDGGSIYTIKNSTITTPSDTDSCAVFISNNKTSAGAKDQGRQTLIVENSVISGQDGIEVQYTDVTISGDGTQVTAAEDGHALGVTYQDGEQAEGTVYVTGGTFTGTVGAMENKGDLNITITGGQFLKNEGIPNMDVGDYLPGGMTLDKTGQVVVSSDAVAQIGNMGYTSLAAAINAAQNGDTITILQEGPYEGTLLGGLSNKKATIKAADKVNVKFDMSTGAALHGAKITFEGVTFEYNTNNNYVGLQHTDTMVYNNCVFNGQMFLYGASETFNGCTFNQNSADAYNVWTYGAKEVEFNDCTFNCAGKSVLVYNEGANPGTDLTVTDTAFRASKPAEGKAAIEIDTSYMKGQTKISVDQATAANTTGFGVGSKSGSSLWNDKENNAQSENITVTVAGEVVLEPQVIDFDAFIKRVEASEYTFDGTLANGKKLTVKWSPVSGCFDTRSGHTCTVKNAAATGNTPNRVNSDLAQYQLFKAATDVTIKNVNFEYIPADFTICANSGWAGSWTGDVVKSAQLQLETTGDGDVTIEGCSFDHVVFTSWQNSGETVIKNSAFKNIYGSYAIKDLGGSSVEVSDCTFENCGGGIMLDSNSGRAVTPNPVTISGNTFTKVDVDGTTPENKVSTRGLLQIPSKGDYTNTAIILDGNTATNCGPTLRQLNESAVGMIENRLTGDLTGLGGELTFTSDSVKKEGAKIYTVKFSGSDVADMKVASGTEITLPTATKYGYTFKGWKLGTETKNANDKVTISSDTTFTAVWQSNSSSSGSSGSSTPTYQVSVDKAEGGKITVSPTRAEKGETVTITVKPDEGYELGKLTVTDKDGDKVTLTQKDDNKYTFKMPAGKVTVKATFTEIEVEPEQPELPFSDVAEQDWFYDAVVYVYENELMNGTSATTFSPTVTTSRAMMLTMLARYDGVDTSTGSTWYEAGAAWAVAEGVSDGTNLEADLTREQLVTMLWRYAGSPMVEKDLPDYPDRDEVSDWAVRAMVWAVDNGIITGNGAGELNPQGSASRAEVATILMRFIQL